MGIEDEDIGSALTEILARLQTMENKLEQLLEKKSEVNRPDGMPVVRETMPSIETKEAHNDKCKCEYCKSKKLQQRC